eukprot:6243308-Pyramimonas_sp.AAC.1
MRSAELRCASRNARPRRPRRALAKGSVGVIRRDYSQRLEALCDASTCAAFIRCVALALLSSHRRRTSGSCITFPRSASNPSANIWGEN